MLLLVSSLSCAGAGRVSPHSSRRSFETSWPVPSCRVTCVFHRSIARTANRVRRSLGLQLDGCRSSVDWVWLGRSLAPGTCSRERAVLACGITSNSTHAARATKPGSSVAWA